AYTIPPPRRSPSTLPEQRQPTPREAAPFGSFAQGSVRCDFVDPPRHLGPGDLGTRVDDLVVPIDEDDLGNVGSGFFVAHVAEARDDREIVRLHVMSGGAVHADDARAARPTQGVGREPAATRDVPDLDFLVFEDASGVEQ